jgi:hypothetical protein
MSRTMQNAKVSPLPPGWCPICSNRGKTRAGRPCPAGCKAPEPASKPDEG